MVIGSICLGVVIILFFVFLIYSYRLERQIAYEKYIKMKENGLTWKEKCYCPLCSSENYAPFVKQIYHEAQTEAKYSASLNPLKPFTINKKEKIIRQPYVTTETMWQCLDCGNIFNNPKVTGEWVSINDGTKDE